MLNKLTSLLKNGFFWVKNGVVPTPFQKTYLEEEYSNICHFKSRKFAITFSALLILAFFYFSSVAILFLIPALPEVIGAYVTIFTKTIEIIGLVIGIYVGAQATIDFKYNSNSNVNYNSEIKVEEIRKNLTSKHEEIYSQYKMIYDYSEEGDKDNSWT